jgi:hypothetical protein
MPTDGSLPHSQEPSTCPYPEPDHSSPHPHSTPKRSTVILSPIYASVFQVVSFAQVCPSKLCAHLTYLPLYSIQPVHLILLDMMTQIIFFEKYRLWSFSLTVTKNHHTTFHVMHISISHLHRTCLDEAYTTVPQTFRTSLSDLNVWSKFEGFLNNTKDANIVGEQVHAV